MRIQTVDRRESLRLSIFRLGSIGAAVLLVVVLTVTRSHAAFTATTANTGNSLATGSVILTDDDSGAAMFAVSGMTPATPISQCLAVTYSGSVVAADVRLYFTTTGPLATYLETKVEVGSGGEFSDCTGFVPVETAMIAKLSVAGSTHTDFTSGVPIFTASTTPTTYTVRVTFTVDDNTLAQSLSSTVNLTFEAQA